jgi:diguanylate cyclase (GGDEF)-like protein
MYMLYADADNLKDINDTWGHQEGDLALIEVADILKKSYRKCDIIARIGGDEFVVMPIISTNNIDNITGRLDKTIQSYSLKRKRGYNLSFTIGLAYYDPENPSSINDLLVQADKLMYERKKSKRDARDLDRSGGIIPVH